MRFLDRLTITYKILTIITLFGICVTGLAAYSWIAISDKAEKTAALERSAIRFEITSEMQRALNSTALASLESLAVTDPAKKQALLEKNNHS